MTLLVTGERSLSTNMNSYIRILMFSNYFITATFFEVKHQMLNTLFTKLVFKELLCCSIDASSSLVMLSGVRILCWVETNPDHPSRAYAVKMTWAKRCTNTIFIKSDTGAMVVSLCRISLNTSKNYLFHYCIIP